MMDRAAVWFPTAIVVAIAMDFWSAWLHGRVWHGRLWRVHRSHHRPRRGRFEANDALSALHAPIAVVLVLYGCRAAAGVNREMAFGAGVGMTLFGLAYVVVHDGLVHGRLPVGALERVPFLREVARAHRVHHTRGAGAPPFGLFFGPFELARHDRLTRGTTRGSARRRRPSAPRPTGPSQS
jgi:beta-carotene 3-hydroxylase